MSEKNLTPKQQELAQLERRAATLKRQIKLEKISTNPPRQPLWMLVCSYIREHRRNDKAMPFEELVEAMVEAGHELGRYPRRTLKQCVVSPHMAAYFDVTRSNGIDYVKLRPGAKNIHYLPQDKRVNGQQTRRTSLSA